MRFAPQERTALFIDGANFYAATRSLGLDIDYRKLLDFFSEKSNMVRAYYYSALLDSEEYSPMKPLTDWLAYNGYSLVTKPAKEFTDALGRRRIKGNMDIELAIDMLELAPKIEHAVLFSGDSDFRPLVEAVQRKGVRVSVISTIKTNPPMIADELRRQADQFAELSEIAAAFTRRPADARGRAASREEDPA
ncbi:NYN domain-containing protein [Acidocella sp.]|uniref:LabA-like NYN domain-containing protein n=1 Tax=Acidocella sp. TaxID=50710 RepID=UPI0026084C9D|nr:NYN domain-containing protein [Acidocella sp.]MDD2795237.1 NYN domain-containing protein [Acidocella sp.]